MRSLVGGRLAFLGIGFCLAHLFSLDSSTWLGTTTPTDTSSTASSRSVLSLETDVKETNSSTFASPGDPSIALGDFPPDEEPENATGICSLVPFPIPNPASIWSQGGSEIMAASQHALDANYSYHDFTASLLHYMTPDRMQRSIGALPRDWHQMERIMDIFYRRYQYVKTGNQTSSKEDGSDAEPPPKLQLLVMGGSVTAGVLCPVSPLENAPRIGRRECPWAGMRLESFVHAILGVDDVISIRNVAAGGTNTEQGIANWEYQLLPKDMPHPHVVVNAYSTNDMHSFTIKAAEGLNQTLEDTIFDMNQRFIRSVMKPPCKDDMDQTKEPPLLLYLVDYLGNEQHVILDTMAHVRVIHVLCNYYGIPYVNYADAVRDWVYSDTTETWFSPLDWPKRNVHPNMGAHIIIQWMMAFNFFTYATTYCSLHWKELQSHEEEWFGRDYDVRPTVAGVPKLQGEPLSKGRPRAKPRGLPPLLTRDLLLDDISDRWNVSSNTAAASSCGNGPCVFDWVSGLGDAETVDKLRSKMNSVVTTNIGWDAIEDNGKLGFATSSKRSRFVLELTKLDGPVRTVNLMVMKSYGAKWQNSTLRIDIEVNDKRVNGTDIVGYHEKTTSETYNYQIGPLTSQDTDGAVVGDKLTVKCTLIGGRSFKIMGLAICDH